MTVAIGAGRTFPYTCPNKLGKLNKKKFLRVTFVPLTVASIAICYSKHVDLGHLSQRGQTVDSDTSHVKFRRQNITQLTGICLSQSISC